jgi:hypothetical protein
MGIYVTLRSPSGEHVAFRDWPLIRLHYATEALRFFYDNKIFVPENIDLWHNFADEALGGTREPTIQVSSDIFRDLATVKKTLADRSQSFEKLMSTIIVISGYWDLNGEPTSGFFSINNSLRWRTVYKDLEIDASGHGDTKDLTEIIWAREDGKGIANNFARTLKKTSESQKATPNVVYFSIGTPAKGDIENLLGVYLGDRRALLDFLYSTLNARADEETKDAMIPLKRSYFIGVMDKEPDVQNGLTLAMQEANVFQKDAGSYTFLADDRKGFENLYKIFEERVFKPVLHELPRTKEVESRIKKGLGHMPSLV